MGLRRKFLASCVGRRCMLYVGFRGCQIGNMPSPENWEADFSHSFFPRCPDLALAFPKGFNLVLPN